jgi:inactive STAND/Caspase domain
MSQPFSIEPRRYLIAIGSPYCPGMRLPDLAHVESDIQQITDLFKGQGYERVLSDQIHVGATSPVIKQSIVSWFSSSDRQTSDHVVVYYGGHGDEGGNFGQHYLFTVESTETKLSTTAIETSALVRSFFQGDSNTSPQNILLILDTCYANAGGRQISASLSQLKGVAPEGSGFWMISSSDSNTEAGDGAFVEALCAVMHPDCEEFQQGEVIISIDRLLGRINQHFERTGQAQRAIVDGSGVQQQAAFIRNPRHMARGDSNFQETQGQEQRPDQIAQLIDCLWSLDYKSQSRAFEDYTTPRSRRAAAFVVQAKNTSIQHWLVKRLVKQLPNVKNAKVLPFVIPAHPMWKQRNFDELWIDLGKKLECKPDKTTVLDALAATYQTKPVICAMYDWPHLPALQERSQKLQKEVLTEFWQPLVRKIKDLPSQPHRSRLILFLAEGSAKAPEVSDDLNVPIRLAPLIEIGSDDVAEWLESDRVNEILGEDRIKVLIEEEIIDWESDPMETLKQICYVFELENGVAPIESEWRLVG